MGVDVAVRDVAREMAGEGGERGLGDRTEASLLHLQGALPECNCETLGPKFLERGREAGAADGVQGVGGSVGVGCANRENLLDALAESPGGLGDKGVDVEVVFSGEFLVLVDLEGLAGRGSREGHRGGGANYLVCKGIDDANLNV